MQIATCMMFALLRSVFMRIVDAQDGLINRWFGKETRKAGIDSQMPGIPAAGSPTPCGEMNVDCVASEIGLALRLNSM